jgi:outer membrane receptor protein involved in Fe transport
VTAQKRSQIAIDVPLSITAITNADIARRGASTIEDLQYSVPGISITEFSPGQQRVQIRGISAYSGLPTVGVYQDELPLNLELNQTGQDVRLLDINRVEVLRGPQGTLYGQGAVGGTIRYITNDVDLAHFGASATGEVAGVDSGGTDWKGEAMVNMPMVTDQLGARFAGSYQHFGGWIDNPLLGQKNVNGGHALTLRGKLAMKFTDDFKLSLMVQHQDLKVGAQSLSDDDQQVFDHVPAPYSSKATMVNAVATYDMGFATLLSSTGYIHRRDDQKADITDAFAPLLSLVFGLPAGIIKSVSTDSPSRYNIFTEEVRLSSNGTGPLNWTIGGFYRNAHTFTDLTSALDPAIFPSGFSLLATEGTNPSNSRSWAAFGEGSYRIASNLTALVGLRYFEDRRYQNSVSTVFGVPSTDIASAKFHALSPRFNLAWQPIDQLHLYANVAKGFRSGGFNLTAASAGLGTVPAAYKPDTVWSYELGGKFQTADRKLSIELAGYRNVWDHVQTTTSIPGFPTSFTTNGGKLSGWGADGSLSYSPVRALTLSLTAGWNRSDYKSDTLEHLMGDPADYVPRFTGSASAEYRFDLASLPSFVRVDYQHSARFQVYLRNLQTAPAFSDEQNIVNLRVGVSGKSWSASAFVRNLLNRDSILYPAFASLVYPARLQPRTAGLTFSVNY